MNTRQREMKRHIDKVALELVKTGVTTVFKSRAMAKEIVANSLSYDYTKTRH
jgi:hypothetical protein